MEVVLRKLGKKSGGSHAVRGTLTRSPRLGSVVVVEFSDGMHEYVTTPILRILHIADQDVCYLETGNSRYRLEYCATQNVPLSTPVAR